MTGADGGAPTLRVLVVDDEPHIASLHARLIRSMPEFEVAAIAHTGTAALRAIEQHDPHIVLLDFGLPDIDGREILRRIRASNRSGVEIIALTAANDLASVRFARSAGVHHYLVKPFVISALRERLEQVLDERRAAAAASASDRLRQSEVDRLLLGETAPIAVQPLPKGLGAETLDRVRSVLSESSGDLSASEIANLIGTSRVTARRYLEFLLHLGEADMQPKYGSAGRPENRYSARPAAGQPPTSEIRRRSHRD